jgi:hypothetical protein
MESVTKPVDPSTTPEVVVDRWKNRRRMCWLAMLAGLVFPVLVLATKSNQLGVIATPFYLFVSLVVTAYIGGAVVDDNWSKK